jgi:hypothetical protein
MDFFEDEPTETVEETVVEKIKIGDEEFDPTDLQEIVNKGKWAREVEEKQNTKLDKLMPEFTKATQRVKELEEKEKAWNDTQEKKLLNTPATELSEEEQAIQAKIQARKLGLLTVDDVNDYVTKRMEAVQQANELLDNCRKYEKEVNGEDGRPKFDIEEVLEHMKETGIKDPIKAYKDKYEDQLEKWKEDQLNKAKKSGLYTETGSSGNHEPTPIKIDKNNLQDALTEALNSVKE